MQKATKGPPLPNGTGSSTIFQTFKQMHKASKVPPLSTGIAPPESSKHSNKCTRHRRSHHSQLEWLLHNLLNIQTRFKLSIHTRTRPRRSHHFKNGFPTSHICTDNNIPEIPP